MEFYKTTAFGNDFIHVDNNVVQTVADCFGISMTGGEPGETKRGELSRKICTRETGAGADGVIYYGTGGQTVSFDIFNRDGSRAEISGNGMAGLASVLFYTRRCQDEAVLETRVGQRRIRCLHRDGNRFRLSVDLGQPDFEHRAFFPFLEENKDSYSFGGIIFYPVSVGNPHAVVVMDKTAAAGLESAGTDIEEQVRDLGGRLAGADLFPQGTNVEFVIPSPDPGLEPDYEAGNHFRIFYYERGVGMTGSSSTGSAAVFAVLRRIGLVTGHLSLPVPKWQGRDDDPIKISGKSKILVESSTKIVYKGRFLRS